MEGGAGFAVGKASDGARPTTMDRGARKTDQLEIDDDNLSTGFASPLAAKHATFGDFDDTLAAPLDRNEAYAMFKQNQGADLNTNLLSQSKPLKEVKQRLAASTKQINALQTTIEKHKAELAEKTRQRKRDMEGVEGAEDIVDEEEFKIMLALKDTKREYKKLHAQWKADSDAKRTLLRSVQQAKEQLVRGFDQWYSTARPTEGAAPPAPEDDMDGDQLDDGEQFEQLEINRVTEQDPDSLAFFQAQKKMRSTANHDRTANSRKQKLKRNQ